MKFFILSFISILFFGCTNSDKKIDLNDYNRLITQTKSLIANKSYKNAIIKCDVALEITDTLSEAFLYKGISLMHLNEFEDAIDAFDYAIDIEGETSAIFKNKAFANLKLNNYDDFFDDINTYIKHHKNDSESYLARGDYYSIEKKYENAIQDYTTCLKFKPRNSIAILKRATAYSKIGNNKFGIIDYTNYLKLKSKDSNVKIYFERGKLFQKDKSFSNALKDFSKTNYVQSYRLMGDCYSMLGEANKALVFYTKYLHHDSNNYEILKKRSLLYSKLGDINKSNVDLEKGNKIDWDSKGFFNKYKYWFLFLFIYGISGLILFLYSNNDDTFFKKTSKAYQYFVFTGLVGGHFIYLKKKWNYWIFSFVILLFMFLNTFNITNYYNYPQLLITTMNKSVLNQTLLIAILIMVSFDLITLTFQVFSFNKKIRDNISPCIAKERALAFKNLKESAERKNKSLFEQSEKSKKISR